ncbi:hypothetical protein OZX62_06780 [Bifidobacterium sp. ESL0690]|uniref:hypothetical protein n=1 Tax=Bifidobacterium sp. ESL0690 TaxID=2983214 RepID=UPI0023F6E0C5|nr:hypothetical protein [Bifidobacterium sp. ESL0690]WEV46157.1 hypothetical protein OZX62_06780 [Bifidobacterium sp. ESL0690]
MRRGLSIVLSVCLALSAVPALASCAPKNAAVGDTTSASRHINHDSVDKSDLLIGVVTTGDEDLDRTVLDAFSKADIKAVYAPMPDGTTTLDPVQSFKDMARRPVNAFVVNSLNMQGNQANGWDEALQTARDAGIPVILVNAGKVPSDANLYAESLQIVPTAEGKGTVPFDQAVQAAINDNPHSKTMSVTLP